MKFLRASSLVAVAVAIGAIAGCSSAADPEGTAAVTGVKEGDQSKGDRVNTSTEVVHDPKQAPDTGGYRITPANPSDPKFKADPKLGGGG
jgi:hypothetical protein